MQFCEQEQFVHLSTIVEYTSPERQLSSCGREMVNLVKTAIIDSSGFKYITLGSISGTRNRGGIPGNCSQTDRKAYVCNKAS
jgi:hypothetical protein